jgi:hypothetical protein
LHSLTPRNIMSDAADQLVALGAAAVLAVAAERGLITDLWCQMPECRCPKGRSYFEKRRRYNPWAPSADRYPVPGRDGGLYVPDNVRLAHLICNQADGGRASLGRRHTAKARANMSTALLGNQRARGHTTSVETRSKLSVAQTGRKHAKETLDKISAANLGRKVSPETRARISCKKRNINRGKPCTCGSHTEG